MMFGFSYWVSSAAPSSVGALSEPVSELLDPSEPEREIESNLRVSFEPPPAWMLEISPMVAFGMSAWIWGARERGKRRV